MEKLGILNQKTLGIGLSIMFYGCSLYGQSTQSSADNNQQSEIQRKEKKESEIEKQREWVENELKKSIIPDAAAVIEETKKAVEYIDKGQDNNAKSSIDRATKKIDDLMTRHPGNALLPIDFDINVIDTAPLKINVIKEIGMAADRAVNQKDYPEARLFLDTLQSEINVYTFALPLAIYPEALKKAKQFLDQNKPLEAKVVLDVALDALVVIQQTLPIPIIESKVLLNLAEEKEKENNREAALKLLTLARYELERSKALGYLSKDEREFVALNDSFKDLERQINNQTSNPSAFQSLKEKFSAFLKRYFGERKQSVKQ